MSHNLAPGRGWCQLCLLTKLRFVGLSCLNSSILPVSNIQSHPSWIIRALSASVCFSDCCSRMIALKGETTTSYSIHQERNIWKIDWRDTFTVEMKKIVLMIFQPLFKVVSTLFQSSSSDYPYVTKQLLSRTSALSNSAWYVEYSCSHSVKSIAAGKKVRHAQLLH